VAVGADHRRVIVEAAQRGHERVGIAMITSRVRSFGTNVVLPIGLPVSGEILTSHVHSIDTPPKSFTRCA
jgi:mRNA-degrading endonuclease toxin of MazEF toxin-antitoxin module